MSTITASATSAGSTASAAQSAAVFSASDAMKSLSSAIASASAAIASESAIVSGGGLSLPSWMKWLGLIAAIMSGVLIGSSFVLKKKGLLAAQKKYNVAAGESYAYLKSPMWWSGMTIMILGEVLNLIAYAVTSAVLVTPLGALSVVVSVYTTRGSSFDFYLPYYTRADLCYTVVHLPQGEADSFRQDRLLFVHRRIHHHCSQCAFPTCCRSDQRI